MRDYKVYVPFGVYLTIILGGRAGYRMIDNEQGAYRRVGYLSFNIQQARVE